MIPMHDDGLMVAEDMPGDESANDYGDDQQSQEQLPVEKLMQFMDSANIAADLDKDTLNKIGQEVLRGYDTDKGTRADWEKMTNAAMDLALQVSEPKTFPWVNAANIKFPLITVGAIQFSARAYPQIVKGSEVVKGEVCGPDETGEKTEIAKRIGNHMSYQLLEQMEEWDEDTDKLLLQLAIVGCAFRKTYFDTSLNRNCSALVSAKDLVYDHKVNFLNQRRITQEIRLFKNEVIERMRSDIFVEVEFTGSTSTNSEEDEQLLFLEQHCWYDLDKDGYKEPYIVTVLHESGQVARITARYDADGIMLNRRGEVAQINPVPYYTKYAFFPNPDGGSYDIGLGILLNPINEAVNALTNQLLNAGTLATTSGGFIGNGLKIKGGQMTFTPGEFKPVDNKGQSIADNIYHMQFPEPSRVLFELLGMLIDAGRDISSTKDILLGESQGANASPTTTLALIEQGQKLFSAIYKRVYRSLKQEFKKLFRLNKLYMKPEEYFRFNGELNKVGLDDYQSDEMSIVPVADPNVASDAQTLAKAEAMMKFLGDPFFNQYELRRRYLDALKESAIDKLLMEEPPKPPQDPKVLEALGKMELMKHEMEQNIKESDARIDKMAEERMKIVVDTAKTQADTILALAQAEAQEIGTQIQGYLAQLQALTTQADIKAQQAALSEDSEDGNDAGGVSAMGGEPTNPEIPPISPGLPAGADGGMGVGGIPEGGGGIDSAEQYGGAGDGAIVPGNS